MHIIMNDTSINTLDHVRQFLNGLGAMEFRIEAKAVRYTWIQGMLLRFHYPQLRKAPGAGSRPLFIKDTCFSYDTPPNQIIDGSKMVGLNWHW